MKIQSIQIQKFRSIDNAKISIEQVLALVGQNNAGKSHVLRALNAFFNFEDEKRDFISLDHMFSSRARPKITVVFNEISEDDDIDNETHTHTQSLGTKKIDKYTGEIIKD